MPTFGNPVEQAIHERMESLDAERDRLRKALNTLNSESSAAPSAPDPVSPQTRNSGGGGGAKKRGPRTSRRSRGGMTRGEQALEFLKANPGASSVEIAKGIDISTGHAYQVMGKLTKENKVKKDGSVYTVA